MSERVKPFDMDDIVLMEQLNRFKSIGLARLGKVALLDRRDTKYIFHINQLANLLTHLQENYKILTINDKRIFAYQTDYYDTKDFIMYLEQHNERVNRYKIRTRTYLDTHESYIEVKRKNNKGHTFKERALLDRIDVADFVAQQTPYRFQELESKLRVNFSRITLTNKALTERVTIDTGLLYRFDDAVFHFPELVILELKQDRSHSKSLINGLLRMMNVPPRSLSKYCFGIINLYPEIKKNRYKKKSRYIEKVLKQYG